MFLNMPWFAAFANYLSSKVLPKRLTFQQKKMFFSDLEDYFYRRNIGLYGKVETYAARLVAKGYSQKEVIN